MAPNTTYKVLVLSGKGGVGKSSIAANLAVWLSMQDRRVGLLDIDIHGPSIPKLLNLESRRVEADGNTIKPVSYSETLKVLSIGLLLGSDTDAVIWRGPMKHNLIRQFMTDVNWGNLDYLIVDCPPGTGDEPLSIAQLLGVIKPHGDQTETRQTGPTAAVIITTPQQLAVIDVKKCITFCRQLSLPVLGVIENMSGFVCPHCNRKTDIFKSAGGEQMATDLAVPFLGAVPIDSAMTAAGDAGQPFICSEKQNRAAEALATIFQSLFAKLKELEPAMEDKDKMRIAIPITNGRLSAHFGHCEQFAIVDADPDSKHVTNTELLTPPAHEPGVLPKWLSGLCVDLVIAGGMGQRAQQLFAQNNIDVVVGAADNPPDELARQYLTGRLECGQNICEH
ncbi:MAG TPA: iron-sulfur cluster carrier protein MrpORP [Sedimentisphaerales bacterium]|nr:iron-sulfur cluster carrier protein MrpORP [Sedimentisphaerales bacterium]